MVPPQRPKILPPARSEPSGKAAWRSLLEGSADARRMAVSSDPDLDFDRLGAAADLKIGLRVPVAQCNSTPAGSAGPLLIHIVAFATPYAAQTQACWLQWGCGLTANVRTATRVGKYACAMQGQEQFAIRKRLAQRKDPKTYVKPS